ncbi:MAG: Lrp/AsnC ligand binding domain-containing protein [Euryarchaeota archaeon]|nr:Lrp/AsnC ligand binding domain-containing protein [Euryarchaeota archaeon]MDI6903140.1 Lrp/AsnC ligand binding domain-containing protein [Methanocellales archaeon]
MVFVILRTAVGHETKVANALAKIDGVSEVYLTSGKYDILVKVDVEDMEKTIDLITEKLRKVGGIQETRTIFAKRIK